MRLLLSVIRVLRLMNSITFGLSQISVQSAAISVDKAPDTQRHTSFCAATSSSRYHFSPYTLRRAEAKHWIDNLPSQPFGGTANRSVSSIGALGKLSLCLF